MISYKSNRIGRNMLQALTNEEKLSKLFCGHCGTPMVGISGTEKGGEQHYYYSCQKHRLEHTCEKKNVPRDFIEDAVCRGAVDYVLQYYVIEWMADCVMDYQNQHKDDGTINILATQKN